MIDRSTLYFADAALYIEGGSTDPNNTEPNQVVPTVSVVNTCLTGGVYYGLYQSQGQASVEVQYCGFAGNHYRSNIDLPFTGCVDVYELPFYNQEPDWKRLYIDPFSSLVDAGYGMATDGMGISHDRPDTGQMDIGCHFALGVSGGFGLPSSPADFNWDGIVDELDLSLMDACMAAGSDPNVVVKDLNYDSRVNLPDVAWFVQDYGYSIDPNESTNNDPNCARSDFDGDHRVNISDLAMLAADWLTPVFDEYRVCSLCNLHTAPDPNDPNAPSGAHIIDQRDMDAFMADWGKQYAFEPNIVIEQSASMLSVAVENPAPAWRISAFLDEEPIGQWDEGGLGSTAFDADLMRFGPGSHKLKIVRNIDYGLEITEQVITDPNSTGLYFADTPDTFEPNEPYCIRGFNLGDELNIKIKDIYDTPIYDVNIATGAVDVEISPEFFADELMMTFTASQNIGNTDQYEKLLKQEFDREAFRGKYIRYLVLLPDKKVTDVFEEAIFASLDAIHKRGPANATIILTNTDVNYENLKFCIFNCTFQEN